MCVCVCVCWGGELLEGLGKGLLWDLVASLLPLYLNPQFLLALALPSACEHWLCSQESWSPPTPLSVLPVPWVASSCMNVALLISLDRCGLSLLPLPFLFSFLRRSEGMG